MDLYGFLWILIWNLYGICMELFVWIFFMDSYWRFCIPLFCVESLFGLVVVLNRGKICIEKMLGFRGDAVRFFFNPCFCFGHNLAITHSNRVIKIFG